jgi:SAM-dependent methyltransferase
MTTDDDLFARHAHSFGAVADVYERGRPSYPEDAARWILPAEARVVADVGAGTGKFSRVLRPLVDEVIAVEPDEAMRAQLERSVAGVRTVEGSGEAIPLDDGSVDAVTFAQAWHWVQPELGSREAARVLRPGGVLGLVWNIRDESVPWVARLSEIIDRPESHAMTAENPDIRAPFGAAEHREFHWVDQQSREAFLAMITSRSYIITMPADERAEVVEAIQELIDTDPELRGRTSIPVPYTTYAHRAVRP